MKTQFHHQNTPSMFVTLHVVFFPTKRELLIMKNVIDNEK